jgi:ABC-type uncharacterized transport system substrate-binding protein
MAPQAQQAKRLIGFLNSGLKNAFTDCFDAFKQGLSQTGNAEGTHVTIDDRWAEGDYGQLRALADKLVATGVEVIAATGGVSSAREAQDAANAKAARDKTPPIPIVFICGFDPTDRRVGLVTSLCTPGGNATGVNVFNTELLPQRRELLSQLAPKSEIALLLNPAIFLARTGIEQSKVPDIRVLEASNDVELEKQFAVAESDKLAVLVDADSFFTSRRQFIVDLASKYKVFASYPWREYVRLGGLTSYGGSLINPYRQVGVYTGMVLNSAKPADLPILQPTCFQLVINRGKARTVFGLEIPPALLARADEVIE